MSAGRSIFVGLDIGSSELRALAVELGGRSPLYVLGYVRHASSGIVRGEVVNVGECASAIKGVMTELESVCGLKINAVHIGITGAHIRGFNSRGIVSGRRRKIERRDVLRAIDEALAEDIGSGARIINGVMHGYCVDGRDDIENPIGMTGRVLEVRTHIFTASSTIVDNLVNVCTKAGLAVQSFVPSTLAASRAVLYPEETTSGVIVVDIGAAHTGMAMYQDKRLFHMDCFQLGSGDLTREIASKFRISTKEAEKLSRVCLLNAPIKAKTARKVAPGPGISLENVMKKWLNLLFENIQERCERAAGIGYQGGIVLTGGMANIPGLPEVAERYFKTPVRLGWPSLKFEMTDGFDAPENASVAGILHYLLDINPAAERICLRRRRTSKFQSGLRDRLSGIVLQYRHYRKWMSLETDEKHEGDTHVQQT